MSKKHQSDGEMLKGTLDMMILRTLVTGDAHGHTIAKVIERTSEDVLKVEQGSLYPALRRLEDRGWVSSYWGRARTIAKRVRLQQIQERHPQWKMGSTLILIRGSAVGHASL